MVRVADGEPDARPVIFTGKSRAELGPAIETRTAAARNVRSWSMSRHGVEEERSRLRGVAHARAGLASRASPAVFASHRLFQVYAGDVRQGRQPRQDIGEFEREVGRCPLRPRSAAASSPTSSVNHMNVPSTPRRASLAPNRSRILCCNSARVMDIRTRRSAAAWGDCSTVRATRPTAPDRAATASWVRGLTGEAKDPWLSRPVMPRVMVTAIKTDNRTTRESAPARARGGMAWRRACFVEASAPWPLGPRSGLPHTRSRPWPTRSASGGVGPQQWPNRQRY